MRNNINNNNLNNGIKHLKDGYKLCISPDIAFKLHKKPKDINDVYNAYYINQEGIVCIQEITENNLIFKNAYKDELWGRLNLTIDYSITSSDGYSNKTLSRYLLSKLNVGEHVSKLDSIIIKCLDNQNDSGTMMNTKFEHLFQKVDIRYRKLDINKSKYFDFIDIEVLCSTEVTIDTVKEYKKQIDKLVIRSLKENKKFIESGITVNLLRISNITLTNDKRLIYLLELKEIKV